MISRSSLSSKISVEKSGRSYSPTSPAGISLRRPALRFRTQQSVLSRGCVCMCVAGCMHTYVCKCACAHLFRGSEDKERQVSCSSTLCLVSLTEPYESADRVQDREASVSASRGTGVTGMWPVRLSTWVLGSKPMSSCLHSKPS